MLKKSNKSKTVQRDKVRAMKAGVLLFAIIGIHTSLSDEPGNVRVTEPTKAFKSKHAAKVLDVNSQAYVDGEAERTVKRRLIFEYEDSQYKDKKLVKKDDVSIEQYLFEGKKLALEPADGEECNRGEDCLLKRKEAQDCRMVARDMVMNLIEHSPMLDPKDGMKKKFVKREAHEPAFMLKQFGYVHVRTAKKDEQASATCHKFDDVELTDFMSQDKISKVKALVDAQAGFTKDGVKYQERLACPVLEIVMKPVKMQYKDVNNKTTKGYFKIIDKKYCGNQANLSVMGFLQCENLELIKACGLDQAMGDANGDGIAHYLERAKNKDLNAIASGAPIDDVVKEFAPIVEKKEDVGSLPKGYLDQYQTGKK